MLLIYTDFFANELNETTEWALCPVVFHLSTLPLYLRIIRMLLIYTDFFANELNETTEWAHCPVRVSPFHPSTLSTDYTDATDLYRFLCQRIERNYRMGTLSSSCFTFPPFHFST
jgi:hypothetical protein